MISANITDCLPIHSSSNWFALVVPMVEVGYQIGGATVVFTNTLTLSMIPSINQR